jgi:hypothetical protein
MIYTLPPQISLALGSDSLILFSLDLMTRLLFIAVLVTSSAAAAQEPSRLRAVIDNWGGHSYAVELKDGKLLYSDATAGSNADPITVSPSLEQWHAFRSALDAISVWSWHAEYFAAVFDGTGWSFSVQYPDRSLSTQGANSYPDAHGNAGPAVIRTAVFQQFESAVEALLGGKRFRSEQEASKQ